MFDLRLNPNDVDKQSGTRCSGVLESESFRETFTSSLVFWNANDYLLSWKASVEMLFNVGYSVFLTDVLDPSCRGNYFGFRIFLLEETVYIQQCIFFYNKYNFVDLLSLNFARENLELIDEDGNKMLIWCCPVKDVILFYQGLKSKIASSQDLM